MNMYLDFSSTTSIFTCEKQRLPTRVPDSLAQQGEAGSRGKGIKQTRLVLSPVRLTRLAVPSEAATASIARAGD